MKAHHFSLLQDDIFEMYADALVFSVNATLEPVPVCLDHYICEMADISLYEQCAGKRGTHR